MDDWNVSLPFLDGLFSGAMLNFREGTVIYREGGVRLGGVGTCKFLGPSTKASEKLVS